MKFRKAFNIEHAKESGLEIYKRDDYFLVETEVTDKYGKIMEFIL